MFDTAQIDEKGRGLRRSSIPLPRPKNAPSASSLRGQKSFERCAAIGRRRRNKIARTSHCHEASVPSLIHAGSTPSPSPPGRAPGLKGEEMSSKRPSAGPPSERQLSRRLSPGKDSLLTVRAPLKIIDAVDTWAAKNGVTRSSAVRSSCRSG
jgi:hypothetical protein